tara:strand:- start:646 stop:1704 length:1059 start_codon:yes stop_codon:yes gene_type:complete
MFEAFGNLIAYDVLGLVEGTKLASAIQFFVMDVTKILVLVTIIMFTISLLRSKINNDKIKAYIEGKPKWMAYLLAVCLGAITPFCSCSSIPLFIGFIEAGIPFGIVMAFLITSPMINEVAVPILGMSVGWDITIAYVFTGMLVGILGGLFLEKIGMAKYVEEHVYKKGKKESTSCGCSAKSKETTCCSEKVEEKSTCCSKDEKPKTSCCSKKQSERSKAFKFAYDYTKDTMLKITPYILIGIGIGAWIHGYVPQEFFVEHVGKDNLFAVPLAVLFGIPLYTDAVGVIPVAEVLLAKAVPVGTVMAMMMSVVALSLPELIILRRVLKLRLILTFVLTMFVAFNIVGYTFNMIF